jgi:hypothetical protein
MDVLKPNLIMVLVFYFDIIVFPLFAPVSYLVNYSYGHFFFFFLVVLGFELRASHLLSKHSGHFFILSFEPVLEDFVFYRKMQIVFKACS